MQMRSSLLSLMPNTDAGMSRLSTALEISSELRKKNTPKYFHNFRAKPTPADRISTCTS